MKVAKNKTADDWWVEAGPDLPETMQVVEGPLLTDKQRAKVAFLVHENTSVNADAKLVQVRPMTDKDRELLHEVNKQNLDINEKRWAVNECLTESWRSILRTAQQEPGKRRRCAWKDALLLSCLRLPTKREGRR